MGMQMTPQGPGMPPMGYQTHGMQPSVSLQTKPNFILITINNSSLRIFNLNNQENKKLKLLIKAKINLKTKQKWNCTKFYLNSKSVS